MKSDLQTEMIELSKSVVKISTEISSMKVLLEKLTENQFALVQLGERTVNLQKAVEKSTSDQNEVFVRLRMLEDARSDKRISEIEQSQKWGRVTFVGAMISFIVGASIMWIKHLLQ